ncbi:DUF1697 domain-containing protein [Arvimicrobium flavum]|uniref:DUF1697 domain-containing protein n=1 Tax=Arvimicrobium flavum TaxID=3393320 RepID=UPI00237C0A0A|nr:DUF1697 domain-containing protein [Mesorhizobium shangrilense]
MSGTVYILLFRGVGGATQLPTRPLREALSQAGFQNAGTYINSGNAYLKTDMPRAKMLEKVADICREQFGFTKDIYAPTLAEWRRLIKQNPFADQLKEGRFLHAAVLKGQPEKENIDALRALAADGEGIEIVDGLAYLHTPGGLSSSKLGAKFDKGLGVPNTARNWNTVLKLLELAEKAAK